jgi:hypothetical protein
MCVSVPVPVPVPVPVSVSVCHVCVLILVSTETCSESHGDFAGGGERECVSQWACEHKC